MSEATDNIYRHLYVFSTLRITCRHVEEFKTRKEKYSRIMFTISSTGLENVKMVSKSGLIYYFLRAYNNGSSDNEIRQKPPLLVARQRSFLSVHSPLRYTYIYPHFLMVEIIIILSFSSRLFRVPACVVW